MSRRPHATEEAKETVNTYVEHFESGMRTSYTHHPAPLASTLPHYSGGAAATGTIILLVLIACATIAAFTIARRRRR